MTDNPNLKENLISQQNYFENEESKKQGVRFDHTAQENTNKQPGLKKIKTLEDVIDLDQLDEFLANQNDKPVSSRLKVFVEFNKETGKYS